MKNEFDKLFESHYGISQKDLLSLESLCSLVEEQLDALPRPKKVKELIKEAVISYDAIPDIPVSELGWSDVRTTKEELGLKKYVDYGKKLGWLLRKIKMELGQAFIGRAPVTQLCVLKKDLK